MKHDNRFDDFAAHLAAGLDRRTAVLGFGRLIVQSLGMVFLFPKFRGAHAQDGKRSSRGTTKVQAWLQNRSLRCQFEEPPTYIAAGYDLCIGVAVCENNLTGKSEHRTVLACKAVNHKCPDLTVCAEAASEELLLIDEAEFSRPEAKDLRKTDVHGRECWATTPNPVAVWMERDKELHGICAMPIQCKDWNGYPLKFAVCEPIDPPLSKNLAAAENQEREPVPILECPQVKSCIHRAIESYPSS